MFDKEKHILIMKPHADKLISYLSKKGVTVTNADNDNVLLKLDNKECLISHHCFYRFSGISRIYKEKGLHELEEILIDDDMFMNSYMKSIIEHIFLI